MVSLSIIVLLSAVSRSGERPHIPNGWRILLATDDRGRVWLIGTAIRMHACIDDRDRKREGAPQAGRTLNPNTTTMGFDEPTGDRQAQAAAAPAGTADVYLTERLEDQRQVLGRDADAGVADADRDVGCDAATVAHNI